MGLIVKADSIYRPQATDYHYLIVENGRVINLTTNLNAYQLENYRLMDYSGYQIIPGLIDIHIHGGAGVGVMDGSIASIRELIAYAAQIGITSFLPTTLTAPLDKLKQVLDQLKQVAKHSEAIIGVHLEGPFINPQRAGAQAKEHIISPTTKLLAKLLSDYSTVIKLVSLAPEISGGIKALRYLEERGIITSVAHSNANLSVMEEAFAAGLNHATHFFNQMAGFHHRRPGVVGAVLNNENCSCEFIADGIHLHPQVIELLVKTKRLEQLILVSDSLRAAGMAAGDYKLGGLEVRVTEDGRATLADGTLAGSTLQLREAVRNVVEFTALDFSQALQLATFNPAVKLGIESQKGTLEPGTDADFVVVDDKLEVIATYQLGELIYCN
ncbi:MAG: N-acetylglucosamine-6-phosphate deacetylase [Bacillota bacterium]